MYQSILFGMGNAGTGSQLPGYSCLQLPYKIPSGDCCGYERTNGFNLVGEGFLFSLKNNNGRKAKGQILGTSQQNTV